MKAHVDGMRSFVYYVASLFDREALAETDEERETAQGLIDLLTPLVKGYCTDVGYEVCVQAIQVYGGYGYTQEYPVEQLTRDAKICSVYEGTNGIQAMDLLGRKLGMKKGRLFMDFMGEIQKTIAEAKSTQGLEEMAARVETALNRLGELAMYMGKTAASEKVKTAFADAMPFMMVMGDVLLAWMHLWRAVTAAPKLKKAVGSLDDAARLEKAEKNKDAAFYDGQLRTAQYFIYSVLPGTLGKMDAILTANSAPVQMHEKSFGGM